MAAKKKLVLIVEDEKPMARLLVESFKEAGLHTVVATQGDTGLAQALSERPDLILLDIVMPGMDGLTMLKKLRQDTWGKTVPVILLTNFGDTDKIIAATESGAYGYLLKANWEIKDIVAKVREALHLS